MKKKYNLIRVLSDESALNKIHSYIEEICDRYNLHQYFGTISLAVLEAAENAIRHGNRYDPKKSIEVRFSQAEGGVSFSIIDQGEGFEYSKLVDTIEQEETSSKGGIQLMKILSTKLSFEERGAKINLFFMVGGIDIEKVLRRGLAFEHYFAKCGLPKQSLNELPKTKSPRARR